MLDNTNSLEVTEVCRELPLFPPSLILPLPLHIVIPLCLPPSLPPLFFFHYKDPLNTGVVFSVQNMWPRRNV